MEREPISKKEQIRDAKLIALSGGVIGIISAVAESNILSSPNLDIDTAIWAGGLTLVGASLVLNGAVRYTTARKIPEEDRE